MQSDSRAVDIIAGTKTSLAHDMMTRLARFRYRVFVEMLGWDLPCRAGQELDQFDRPDTMYLVARQQGRLVGTARLLPTHRPYLLRELFPQLMPRQALPDDSAIWELSRFTALDLAQVPVGGASRQFSSPIAVQLLHSVLQLAAEHGVQRLITVSPLGIERLLRRAGFSARRAGPPQVIGGHAIFACWIDVPRAPEY